MATSASARRPAGGRPAGKTSPRTAATDSPAVNWPPYGFMPAGWEAGAQGGPWPQNFDSATWDNLLQQVGDEFARELWPRRVNGAWVGAALATSEDLTRADLDLMRSQLQPLHRQPVGAQGELAQVTHRALFTLEDDIPVSGYLFETVRRYLEGMPAGLVAGVIAEAGRGIGALGPRPMMFKRVLQRPRPHQVSQLLQLPFDREHAKSAVSPAMISGHALQGLFLATYAYVAHHVQFDPLPGARAMLLRYATDFGDRRVFAGVHYPSDNVSSWYLALSLSDRVFGPQGPRARKFMVDAVRQSTVYAALKHHATTQPRSAFSAPMAWLDAALATP